MPEPPAIVRRKDEHLDIALRQRSARANAFDDFLLEHCALPELNLDEVDLRREFLGWRLRLPFLISSMTGGPDRGAVINTNLAEAAEQLQIPLAVGSQRIALEGAAQAGIDGRLREVAPSIPIWSNLGAAQLVQGCGVDQARRAMEMVGADALVIHLNPLQEAVQSSGDRCWTGVLAGIEALATRLGKPIIAKEVGYGISAPVARRLRDAGVAALDVAGAGGTDWAAIEAERAESATDRKVAEAFHGWGLSTARALAEVRGACPDLPIIGSGGVRDGVDAAKAIRLGADLVGQARGVLAAALVSGESVVHHFGVMAQQLRVACFCTGARDLISLQRVRLLPRVLSTHNF